MGTHFESLNGNVLDRAGVNEESQKQRLALAAEMNEHADQRAMMIIAGGAEQVASQAETAVRADLKHLQGVVNRSQELDSSPESGWQILRQRNMGGGGMTMAKILDALTTDVPSLPGEKPIGASSSFINYSRIRSRVKGAPPIDRYNVNIGRVRKVMADLRKLSTPPEEQWAMESVIGQLEAYAAGDRLMEHLADISEKKRSSKTAEGFKTMSGITLALGGTVLTVLFGAMGMLSGNWSPLMLATGGIALYKLYPDLFKGKQKRAAEQSIAVVDSPMYKRLAAALGGKKMQEVLDMLQASGNRKITDDFIRNARGFSAGREPLEEVRIQALVAMIFPNEIEDATSRAVLQQAIKEDPNGMKFLMRRVKGLKAAEGRELVHDVTENEGYRYLPRARIDLSREQNT